ncbi:hypothetical protein [Roseivirga echinicomitans]|uniref:hypothetical protein n=1 Tax=Roseivirga echinicomitans TaxID=296218 RepID=UPI0012FD5BC9|nr:hypothetical protein [Roseivirga echinicomitans]
MTFFYVVQGCEKGVEVDELPEEPELPIVKVDESFFYVADIKEPWREALFSTDENIVYLFSREENGKMIIYNYESYSVVAEGVKSDKILDYPVAIGQFNDSKELYIGSGKYVNVYDGKTLEHKEKLRALEDGDSQYVSSLEFREPNLLFIGACNTSNSNKNKGTLTIDRSSGQRIARSQYGDNCVRIKTFKNGLVNDEIGVFGVGFQTSSPWLISDLFDKSGDVVSNSFKAVAVNKMSRDILATSEDADYFVTGERGNIFDKKTTDLLGSLNGDFRNYFLNDDGSKIFAIKDYSSIEVFEYPSLKSLGLIKLADESLTEYLVPTKGFVDGDKVILVYLSIEKIYMSKLDIPKF